MGIDLVAEMDGIEAATRILKIREVPIVFLSSRVEPDIVARTERITSYGYAAKNSGITVLDASGKMAFKLFLANKRLVDGERKHEVTISNISDVIAIMGSDGTIKYSSPGSDRSFGWLPEDVVGTPVWPLIHPSDLERVREGLRLLLGLEGARIDLEILLRCKDGSYKPIEVEALGPFGESRGRN
jgi:PAS domain S-box-containing protein